MDDALAKTEKEGHAVEVVLVYDNARAAMRETVNFVAGRDVWWTEAVSAQSPSCPVEWLDAEDTLFKVPSARLRRTWLSVLYFIGLSVGG